MKKKGYSATGNLPENQTQDTMLQPRWPKSGKGGSWKPPLSSTSPDVLAEKQMWRADPAWSKWGAGGMVDSKGAGRVVDMDSKGAGGTVDMDTKSCVRVVDMDSKGAGRTVDIDTRRAGRVVGTGRADKVVAGRDGGRWLVGPKDAPGRNGDRWGGGKRILLLDIYWRFGNL